MNSRSSLLFVLFLCVLASCFEGDPGPQGDQGAKGDKGDQGDKGDKGDPGSDGYDAYDTARTGYFKGVVSGVRKDGVPYVESFKYNSSGSEDFFAGSNNDLINIYRRDLATPENRYLGLFLKIINKNLPGETLVSYAPSNLDVDYSFSKEAEDNKIFIIKAHSYTKDLSVNAIEISNQLNDEFYHFYKMFDGKIQLQINFNSDGSPPSFSALADNNGVGISAYYSETGKLISVGTPNGPVTGGPLFDLYNRLTISYNSDLQMYTFHDATTGESLHGGGGPIAGDDLIISNYLRDPATGIITFDFEISIDAERGSSTPGTNSTRHDINIKGKFNSGSKVYLEVI